MITLTKLNGKKFVLNSDLIEHIEETPDTVITLTNNRKVIVNEGVDEVVSKIVKYRRKIFTIEIKDLIEREEV